jgi:hypothetical protein
MMDRLNQFFGQDNQRQQEYQDFSRRYEQDPGSISDAEAARRYRELASQLDDDDDLDQAHEEAFSRLSPQERRQLAEQYQRATQDPRRPYQGFQQDYDLERASQPRELGRMTRRASREDPDLLEQLVGQNSPLASTGAKLAMAGAAAVLASKFLGNRR